MNKDKETNEQKLKIILPLLEQVYSCIYEKEIELKLDPSTLTQLIIKTEKKSSLENISGTRLPEVISMINQNLSKNASED